MMDTDLIMRSLHTHALAVGALLLTHLSRNANAPQRRPLALVLPTRVRTAAPALPRAPASSVRARLALPAPTVAQVCQHSQIMLSNHNPICEDDKVTNSLTSRMNSAPLQRSTPAPPTRARTAAPALPQRAPASSVRARLASPAPTVAQVCCMHDCGGRKKLRTCKPS